MSTKARLKTLCLALVLALCTFICTYSSIKVKAFTNYNNPDAYYSYHDDTNHILYSVYMDYYNVDNTNGVLLENIGSWSLSGNLRNLYSVSYRSYNEDTHTIISFMCPFTSNSLNYINTLSFNFLSGNFYDDSSIINLYEVPSNLSTYNYSQIQSYKLGISVSPVLGDTYYSTNIVLQLDDGYYLSSNKRYYLEVQIPVYGVFADETYAMFNTYYSKPNEYNLGFEAGQLNGTQIGIERVLDDPQYYDLYSSYDYTQYGLSEYQKGLNEGNQAFSDFSTIMRTSFGALGDIMSIQIFPGITIALVIGLPILLGLFLIIMKLIRG